MAFFWKAIGLGGSSIPNFNFTVGAEVGELCTSTLKWTMKKGTRIEDNTPVTVFELNLATADPAVKDLARNVAKKAKTLMLPGFLRCFDSTEYNSTVYLATEECIPLCDILRDPSLKVEYYEDAKEKFEEGVALGLRHVGQALHALHNNNIVHGNVCHESIFVLKSGEWRLFGLEFVAPFREEQGLYQRYWSLLPEYRRPPETMGSGGLSQLFPAIHTVDSWGLACLIFAVFGGVPIEDLPLAKGTDMRAVRTVPRSLQSGFIGLCAANPKLRITAEKFLQDSEFVCGSDYVASLQSLDELALKDSTDRDAIYRKLTNAMDSFPIRACKFIILAKLSVAVQFGGGSATALEPILKIGSRLTDPEVFAELVAPIVITLFGSQDAMVRIRLLTAAGQYARLLPPSLVNEKIWNHFCTGFTSANANMRELTVRALVHFAPLLNEKNFSTDVVRYITLLQQDREGPIRTNATICLCLIADHIPEAGRAKTLVHGFGRMLKDPFLPSRVAALRSLHSTLHHYNASQIAEMILPGIAPLTTDPALEIRDITFKIIDAAIELLRKNSAQMPAGQESGIAGAVEAAAHTPVAASTPQQSTPVAASGGWGWGSAATPKSQSPLPPPSQAPLPLRSSIEEKPAPASNSGWDNMNDEDDEQFTAAPPPKSSQQRYADPTPQQQQGLTSATSSTAVREIAPIATTSGVKGKKKGFGGAVAKCE